MTGEVADDLVEVDDQVRLHFDDAALYCDQRLLQTPLSSATAASLGDAALLAYARTLRRSGTAVFATGTHVGESVELDGDLVTNACWFSTSTEEGALGGAPSTALNDGFCRADFNFCLGRELEAHATTLSTGTADARLRASLLRHARERLQAAGLEYLSTLGFYERVCVGEPSVDPAYGYECTTRLRPASGPSYLATAHTRLVDAVERIVALAEIEAELRVDLGDREAREARSVETPDPVLDLFGPSGGRTNAIATLFGPPDGVSFERGLNARRLRPVALPWLSPTDERAAVALELMREYRAPTPLARLTPDGPVQVVDSGLTVLAVYSLLDHRLMASRYRPPYDQVHPPDPTTDLGAILRSRRALTVSELLAVLSHPIPSHESILRTEYQLTTADVGRALYLLTDAYETQLGNFVLEPQLYDGAPGGDVTGFHFLAVAGATVAPRPTQMLVAPFQDAESVSTADPLVPLLPPMPRSVAGTPPDFYAWDLRRVDGSQQGTLQHAVGEDVAAELGAASVLHLMRVHLLRLSSLGSGFIDPTALERAIALIEAGIGSTWTEYDTSRDSACACLGGNLPPPNIPNLPPGSTVTPLPAFCPANDDQPLYGPCSQCFCDLEAPPGGPQDWDLYEPADAVEEGTAAVVHHVEDVRCLLHGTRPGADEPCTVTPAFPALTLGPATTRIGRVRRSWRLPAAPEWASHAYVLWAAPDQTYRLVDVVPITGKAGAHVLGGTYIDSARVAWTAAPWRHGSAAVSSRGEARGLVPPLESELISDSDTYEDSFATYLADAHRAVDEAAAQLAASRDDALRSRLNEVSDAAALEEAATAETAELADLCGDLPDCRIPRAPPLTLRELGIVGDASPLPDLGSYADCDEVMSALFVDLQDRVSRGFGGDDEARAFVREHLGRALGCSMNRYLTELAELRISDLPIAVRDALATGEDPELSAFSGRVREQLLAVYLALDDARSAVRRLEAQRVAASVQIDVAAGLVSADLLDRILCHLQVWVGLASDVVSIVQSIGSAYNNMNAGTGSWMDRGGNGARAEAATYGASANAAGRVQHFVATEGCTSEDAAGTQAYQAAQRMVDSMSVMVSLARRAADSGRSTYFTISALDALQTRAEIAGQRREAARLLAASDRLADLPEWQSLRRFSYRRARASLERAQETVFIARRALEFRLAVDLSSMTDPEPLTPAPATWADTLFDVGSAVASVPESEEDVSVAAEELAVYLDRLQRFVDGYPIARRFRDAGDLQVLDLGELVEAEPGTPITEQLVFRCSGHPDPLPAGRLPGVTAGAPCAGLGVVEEAALHFEIPARFQGYLADRLSAGSFNYRHELLAPNLVGTGVLNCERALDRTECYGDGNVQYSLRHEGPFELEGFDGELLTFFVEPGVIQNGRALVAERQFTTPLGSHDRSLVDPFLRHELRGRPLSGLYSLTIPGRPEIDWSHLERIQLLLGYRYWTRQE
ncbi:MAG: hypothetical protein KC619_33270 [Myxococcales bacterium]|nr:hypothetical protein [Myxococcales bacterium]